MQPLPVPAVFGRWITTLLLIVCIMVVTFHGLSTTNILLLVGLAGFPFAILLLNRLHVWFMVTIGLFYSWIYVPGFSSSLGLFDMFAAATIPFFIASKLMTPLHHTQKNRLKFFMYAYLAITVATICVRGFGLRSLDGEMWGGAAYVHLLVVMSFCLLSDSIRLTEEQWKTTIILFFSAGLIPSIAEVMFLASKGSITWPYAFVRAEGVSALTSLSVMQTEVGVLRFQVSKYIGFIFILFLALFPFKGKGKLYILLSGAVAFVFAGLSGHRSAMLQLLLLIPTFMFFSTRKVPVLLLAGYGVTVVVLALALHIFGRSMPLSFQRSLAWIPFADIEYAAARSAHDTIVWRFDVWERVSDLIPKFWLVGRGLAFQAADYYSLFHSSKASIEWAVITHNYHSGPLALLVDMGAAGLIFGSIIMIGGIGRHYRILSTDWANERIARFHRALLAAYCVDVVRFYLVHGDPAYSIIKLVLLLTIMDGLYITNAQMKVEEETTPDTADSNSHVT